MVAAPTATAPGCGKPNWPPWPPTPACTSPCAAYHPAPRNGTRSNTGMAVGPGTDPGDGRGSDAADLPCCVLPHLMNWRGRPLTSHDVIVASIAATTTRTGLGAHADLDTTPYPTGGKTPAPQLP